VNGHQGNGGVATLERPVGSQRRGVRIDIEGVSRRVHTRGRGEVALLEGVSFSVLPGELVAIVGPSGAGKTTLLEAIAGIATPTSGSVRLDGVDLHANLRAFRSVLGFVPQDDIIHAELPLERTLRYAARLRLPSATTTAEIAAAVRDALDAVGLTDSADVRVGSLSGGQRKRASIAVELITDPRLFFLDEPTSGLDPIVRREFIQTVIGAYQDGDPGRRTVFVSTHLISEFEGLIDEFTIIERGKAVLSLDADSARERYQKIYARFAAEPAALDLPGARVLRQRGREFEVLVSGSSVDVMERLKARSPEALTTESLTLEEIFVTTLQPGAVVA